MLFFNFYYRTKALNFLEYSLYAYIFKSSLISQKYLFRSLAKLS